MILSLGISLPGDIQPVEPGSQHSLEHGWSKEGLISASDSKTAIGKSCWGKNLTLQHLCRIASGPPVMFKAIATSADGAISYAWDAFVNLVVSW